MLPSPKTRGGYRFRPAKAKRKQAQRSTGEGGRVPHRRRPTHAASRPVHVTMRCRKGLPSLRSGAVLATLRRCLRGVRRVEDRFRVVHYSIQQNHYHLLVEARDRHELARGMQRLNIRIALALRRLSGAATAREPYFRERYHAHELRSPPEAHNVLRYVLLNWKHHLGKMGIDVSRYPLRFDDATSARFLDGWTHLAGRPPPPPGPDDEVAPPRTWMLRSGWRDPARGGAPLGLHEFPRS